MDYQSRPTIAEVSLANLQHNYQILQAHVAPAKLMCVLKAEAYGHGLIPVAQALAAVNADYLGVAIAEEGLQLRRAGIKTPILVFGGLSLNQIDIYLDQDLTFTAPSDEKLLAINQRAKERGMTAKVHLKIDTGMGRLGVNWQRVDKLIDALNHCSHVVTEGIYSHFSQAENNEAYTKQQLQRFKQVIEQLQQAGYPISIQHIANSAGILAGKENHLTMIRPGLLLYGIFPSLAQLDVLDLKPVLSWKTHVVYFKTLTTQESVGYGATWQPENDFERVVTLPLGYADGFGQSTSQMSVIIRGKSYKVVGKICMDQCMVSLGQEGTAYNNDEVILIGKQDSAEIRVEQIAAQQKLCPHEILTRISARVPRVYV